MAEDKGVIIDRLIANLAEVITEDELRERLTSGKQLTHYIGFEISGYVHLGTGIMSALVMKDLTDLGVKCTVWLADWHTWINEKLDGTLETAQKIGPAYFEEAIRASYRAVGGNPDDLTIKLASDEYKKDWERYWQIVISIGQYKTVSRMLRSIDIMGRKQGTDIELSKLLYPAMQAADIFYEEVDIAHAGMDQRKAHVIVRDVADKIGEVKGKKTKKAIALHHPLLMGLQKPSQWPVPEDQDKREAIVSMKMSKSDPHSALLVHDSPEEIERKIAKAFCPEKEVEYNPILNWTRHLHFWNREGKPFRIEREQKHGGSVEFNSFSELEQAYASGSIHPMDLKGAVTRELSDLLKSVREDFAEGTPAAAHKAELDKVLAKKKER